MKILSASLLFFFLFSLRLIAQGEGDSIKHPQNGWSIGICSGPNYAKPTYDVSPYTHDVTKTGEWRYGFGCVCEYQFKKHLGIRLELSYDNLRYHTTFINQPSPVFDTVIKTYEYSLINIPIGVDILFAGVKCYFSIGSSMQASLLVGNSYSIYDGSLNKGSLFSNGSITILGKIHSEFGYRLSERLALEAGTAFHTALVPLVYSTSSMKQSSYLKYYKFCIGLNYFF